MALSTRFNTARRSMSRSAVTLRLFGTSTAVRIAWAANCAASASRTSSISARERKRLPVRIAVRGEVQQVVDHHVQGGEAGGDLVQHVEAAAVAGDPPPQQAQVERHGHEVVAHLVGDVRGHLAQVGQAVLPRQLAVLRLQLPGQLLHLGAERLVRLLQPHRGRVPGGQHRLQVGLLVQFERVGGILQVGLPVQFERVGGILQVGLPVQFERVGGM